MGPSNEPPRARPDNTKANVVSRAKGSVVFFPNIAPRTPRVTRHAVVGRAAQRPPTRESGRGRTGGSPASTREGLADARAERSIQQAYSDIMPGVRRVQPADVVAAPDLLITEYFGRVTSDDTNVSSCLCTVRRATKESPQTPGFDEYVMVLEGEIRVYHGAGMNECVVVSAGQGFVLDKGTRVQWEWPGPCKYVAICLPAFSPENAGREEATGPVAKTENALKKLRELHASSSSASSFQPGSIASYAAAVGIGATLGFLLCARAMR